MSDEQAIVWEGKSGKGYKYWINPIGTPMKSVAGNYIFAKETRPGFWKPCYIGQTENLSDRLADHERESCARRNGATHIHTHTNGDGEELRRAEEKDLILEWQPTCNDQFVR